MMALQLYSWYGGKTYMLKHILPMIPPHKYYAELFGGSGVVLLNKPPAKLEIFNDINENIYRCWKVIYEGKIDELAEEMNKILYGQQIREYLLEHFDEIEDEVQKVAVWLFLITSALFSREGKGTFRFNYKRATSGIWGKKLAILQPFWQRIQNVAIVNKNWKYLFEKLSQEEKWQKEGFIYLDPPYPPSTRAQTRDYKHN
jgi:DNA adenine methylase